MNGHGEQLSRLQEQAIAALLEARNLQEAAAAVGVSDKTLRSWLQLPTFRAAYRQVRKRILEIAIGKLQRASGKAVRTLVRNLKAEKPSDQIRAAALILEFAQRGLEAIDHEDRLAALEAGEI